MALITKTEVVDRAMTNANFDTHLIKDTFIDISEFNHLKPFLGCDLYDNISNEVNASTVWTNVNTGCGITSGNTTITTAADSFIKVGDFVTGVGIPVNADSEGTGLCRVETVDTPGAVTSFTISATPTITNATASLTFKRPNGVLKEDYIVDYLAFCVKFEILPDITYNTTSQGVVDNIADFTSPVNEKKLNYLRQETYKKSETFKKKMHLFLDKHSSSYPEWNGCGGCSSCKAGGSNVSKRHGIITY